MKVNQVKSFSQRKEREREKKYLVVSHCFVADLPVDGTFNDARHQLGNILVLFVLAWNFFHCENTTHCSHNKYV